jgi:hypothetical protein
VKDSFYGEFENEFDKLPKYKIFLLIDFGANVGKETFTMRELAMRVYPESLLVMELE